ncbi:hypothetical protein L3Y34_003323 [Caenorhabditis briggsae]|uniref:Uncharacterized protein n=1 Tax=Caenorhabditis briggsae TaxID=6238 RepID=A0AAE9D403_CAEBR|nr:hypothetical protein L3Y34_003323 [Caenorhabditis briggsae]
MDIDDCAYNAGVFFPLDENGKQVIGWWSFAGFAGYLTIMIIPFSIILSFGFKSWRIVGGLLEQGDSEFAKNLQLQLYKALVAQTSSKPPNVERIELEWIVLDLQLLSDENFMNIQTYKSAFFMVVDVKSRHLTPSVAEFFIDLLCGFIAVTVYGIAIHFIYRFLALERSTVKEFFNLDMEDVVYGAAAFFPLDQNGQKFTSYLAFFGLSCYLTLLTIPFLTMLIYHGESEFARNLQMQLYKALIAQTVLPVVFFYIPFGFIFILPIFEIDCQFMAAPVTLVFAIYPALDPLPTLFFVDYYRNAIWDSFFRTSMQIETFANVKTTIQICSVILSAFVNTVSIYLIITKSPKIMGTYRHLMTYFCCCSLLFSLIDAVVQPNIQTYKSAFFMVVDVKDRHLTPWVAELSIRMLCGCIGVTTYGMAIHFVYRFFALEREGRLRFFNQKFLFLWFSIPLFGGVLWFLVTEFTFPMNKETTEYIRSTVKEFFNLDMEDVVYGAAAFFPLDQNGQKFTSYLAFFGLSCYLTLLTIPFLTMLICGLKSWKKVRCLLDHGESEFARNLQMQLYKALIAQPHRSLWFLPCTRRLMLCQPYFSLITTEKQS